eukprot:1944728-Pyramimonas_sp.AAC.1
MPTIGAKAAAAIKIYRGNTEVNATWDPHDARDHSRLLCPLNWIAAGCQEAPHEDRHSASTPRPLPRSRRAPYASPTMPSRPGTSCLDPLPSQNAVLLHKHYMCRSTRK